MWQDPIIDEVRQVREHHAEKFRFDLWAIYQDLKQQERVIISRKVLSHPASGDVVQNFSGKL